MGIFGVGFFESRLIFVSTHNSIQRTHELPDLPERFDISHHASAQDWRNKPIADHESLVAQNVLHKNQNGPILRADITIY